MCDAISPGIYIQIPGLCFAVVPYDVIYMHPVGRQGETFRQLFYDSLFPFVSLSDPIGQTQSRLSYSEKIHCPDYGDFLISWILSVMKPIPDSQHQVIRVVEFVQLVSDMQE